MRRFEMEPYFIIDTDTETEVIDTNINFYGISNGMFYTKVRYLTSDSQGNQIKNQDGFIRVKVLYHVDLKKNIRTEILPFGEFDIKETKIMGSYLYFIKISNKDHDKELSYFRKDIYRVNIESLKMEYCCEVVPYDFLNFEMATDQYLIFCSRYETNDLDHIVVVDLINKKKVILGKVQWWNEYVYTDYKFIIDENEKLSSVVIKKLINDGIKVFQDKERNDEKGNNNDTVDEEYIYNDMDDEIYNCDDIGDEGFANDVLACKKLESEEFEEEKYENIQFINDEFMKDKLICFKWEDFVKYLKWTDLK